MKFTMSTGTLTMFILYLVLMLGIGIWAYRKSNTMEEYFLGGRKMNTWVTAMSAQASDMSGWLLLALPGAVYIGGFHAMWIAIGLAVGTYLNWQIVAKRLRKSTEKLQSITIPDYLEKRFEDRSKILRVVSSLTILFFFLIYVSSGMVSGGKLFDTAFGIPYDIALLIGALVIVTYTFLGGFIAVSYTDLFQGLLMFGALLLVPIYTILSGGGFGELWTQVAAVNPDLLDITKHVGAEEIWVTGTISISLIAIISNVAWGLGYFGQPHILVRFMGIRRASDIPKARLIGVSWVTLTLLGASFVGLVGITLYDQPIGDPETIFLQMVSTLFNPWVAGLLLAAVLSAIMSTIDSQLLVSSSALAEDIYKGILRKNASQKELIWVSRGVVMLVAIIAVILAKSGGSILALVSYAWAGFGAAFGPVLILSLYWKRITRNGAVVGMLVGGLTVIFWSKLPFIQGTKWAELYELVPGFFFALFGIIVVSLLDRKAAHTAQTQYQQMEL